MDAGGTHLSLQDEDLVAESQDLRVPPVTAGEQKAEPAHHETDDERQRPEHDDGPYPAQITALT